METFEIETASEEEQDLVRQIESRAVYLLSMREHGGKELRQKLLQKFPESENRPQLVDFVLDRCRQNNWLSDERFIEASVRLAMEKGQGPYKIKQALQAKTANTELIDAYLSLDDGDWAEMAQEALIKKYGDADKPREMKEQARRMRFLASRGFSQSQIWKAMR
ncbi:MAG: regulatory protein RecX [Hydrogenovibrio sp.]|nr:regulatory protein RecX [Hydrogenovibrio sp.]